MKTIVTHMSPDLDAISAVWLLKRFLKGWGTARLIFVPAGKTLDDSAPDSDVDTIHVDTGLGKFDHHQSNSFTCAAALVLNYLQGHNAFKDIESAALDRLVAIVTDYDHFRIIFYNDCDNDIYDFSIESAIEGLKSSLSDTELVEHGLSMLDGVYKSFFNKVLAEKELRKADIFSSSWGKSMAIITENKYTAELAQKKGYCLVVTKSAKTGHVRIKTRPDVKKDLFDLFERLKKLDPKASWFYHASGHMILNGSLKNPSTIPTILNISQVHQEILKT